MQVMISYIELDEEWGQVKDQAQLYGATTTLIQHNPWKLVCLGPLHDYEMLQPNKMSHSFGPDQ